MAIQSTDLRTTVFKMGSFRGATPTAPGPTLRTSAGKAFNDEENEHFIVNNGLVRYIVNAGPTPGVRVIDFAPTTGADDCFYLPYRDNNITSVRLSGTPDRFFTDNLSGCTVFIDRATNGDLIVFHANRQGLSYKPQTAETIADVTFEREVAIAVKKQIHDDAVASQYNGATPVGSLFKKRYNRGAAGYNNAQAFIGSSERFGGGTTVVGFKAGGAWQFWYQTWNQDSHACRVIGCEQFYP